MTAAYAARLPQEVCVLLSAVLAPLYCLQFTGEQLGRREAERGAPGHTALAAGTEPGSQAVSASSSQARGKGRVRGIPGFHRRVGAARGGGGGGPSPAECFYPGLAGICLFSQLTCLAGLRTTVGSVL